MRPPLFAALVVCAPLLACNQDSASSNAERDTHMGNVRAASPASDGTSRGLNEAGTAPSTASAMAPAVAVLSVAAPAASASASAHPGNAVPAGGNSAPPGGGQNLADAAPDKKKP
jgi:hypothetical protein